MCFTAGVVVSLEEDGTTMAKEERNTTLLRCATVLVCFFHPGFTCIVATLMLNYSVLTL